jgi:hypothetical protein
MARHVDYFAIVVVVAAFLDAASLHRVTGVAGIVPSDLSVTLHVRHD